MDMCEEFKEQHKCTQVLKKIDRYDHEANSRGCKIYNYDYYERQRNIEIRLLIGVLAMYFIFGMLFGFSIMINPVGG